MPTLSEMRSNFFTEYGETSGNSAFSAAMVNMWLNEAYDMVRRLIEWYEGEEVVTIPVLATQLDGDVSADDTTLVLDSVSGLRDGHKLLLVNGSVHEVVSITAVNSTTKTVTISPAVENDWDDDSYVYQNSILLPQMKNLKYLKHRYYNSSDVAEITDLTGISKDDYYRLCHYSGQYGVPSRFVFGKFINTRLINNATAATSTDTTSVYKTAVTTLDDDYYQYCKLVNRTRYKASFITASTQTKYTLIRPIASQVATDSYDVYRYNQEVILYPAPQYSSYIDLCYQRHNYDVLYNDYDEPWFPSEYHKLLTDWALIKACQYDKDWESWNIRIQMWKADLIEAQVRNSARTYFAGNFSLPEEEV